MPHLIKWHHRFLHLFIEIQATNIILNILNRISYKIYTIILGHNFKKWPNWDYASTVINNIQPGSVFILTNGAGKLFREIVTKAKTKDVTCVAITHGLETFEGSPGGKPLVKYPNAEGKKHPHSIYDWIICPNEFYFKKYKMKGISPDQMLVLGSIRYCPEWNDIVSNFSNNYESVDDKSYIKILYLIEKGQAGNNFIFSNVDEQLKVIEFLSEDPGIALVIKNYPRNNGFSKEQLKRLYSFDSIIIDNDYTTPELVNWADIIVAGATSAAFDSISKKKSTIILLFIQPFLESIYTHYDVPLLVNTFQEFVNVIKKVKTNPSMRLYNNKDLKRLLEEFVYAGNKDIINKYSSFIIGLKKDF